MHRRSLALAVALVSFAAFAADAPKPGPLKVTLNPLQSDYEIGLGVRTELTLTNSSAEPVKVQDVPELLKYVRLVPEGGQEQEPVKPERFAPPKTSELGPGGFVGVAFDAAQLFPQLAQPGKYALVFRKGDLTTREQKFRMIPVFDPNQNHQLVVTTPAGDLTIELFSKDAPVAVHNVVNLAHTGFFENAPIPEIRPGLMLVVNGPVTPAHRIVPIEKTAREFLAGTVLLDQRNGANWPSLLFLLGPAPALQGRFTAVGQVVKGLEVLQKLGQMPTTGKDGKPPFRPVSALAVSHATASITPPAQASPAPR